MARIFISHASADQDLASHLVTFLKEAIGVRKTDIFCSSAPGHGIDWTGDYSETMRAELAGKPPMILLITESFLERPFCLMELGAAWANGLTCLPVIVPPVPEAVVKDTLGLIQGGRSRITAV